MTDPATGPATVCVVDDDDSVREALPDLLGEFGFSARAFTSAEAFLASVALDQADCLLLDVSMPGMTGPELQIELKRRALGIPIVFITAQADDALFPRLIAEGAVACLRKPFSETALFDAVTAALARNRAAGG